jgi:hypothetical protein
MNTTFHMNATSLQPFACGIGAREARGDFEGALRAPLGSTRACGQAKKASNKHPPKQSNPLNTISL